MKKFSLVFMLAIVLTSASNLIAQSSTSRSVPCADQLIPGRPVLKLRKTKPDDQPVQEETNAELFEIQTVRQLHSHRRVTTAKAGRN